MRRGYSYSPSLPRRYRRRVRSPSPRDHYGGRGRDLPTSLLVRKSPSRDCRELRGFGFVQYYDPDDAEYYMDGQLVLGRAITVVFAEENRKKPQEMRARDRVRGRSPSRSPIYYSRSPSPPNAKHRYRGRSYSRSPVDSRERGPTPARGSRSPYEERYGRSTRRERSLSVSG